MGKAFPWVPVGTKIGGTSETGKLLSSGTGYQVISEREGKGCLLLIRDDAQWLSLPRDGATQRERIQELGGYSEIHFGKEPFLCVVCPEDQQPSKVGSLTDRAAFGTGSDLLELSIAMAGLTNAIEGASLESSLYLPSELVCVATEILEKPEDMQLLAVRLLTGGVADKTLSPEQIHQLNRWIRPSEVEHFFSTLGFLSGPGEPMASRTQPPQGEFRLPGRPEIESFFQEKVVDYYQREEEYKRMGVLPPNGIILHGPPGTGKTFAVRKLSEFLGWPVFDVDMSSIGSPFVHETTVKLSRMFKEAARNAPSIVIMDEIDAIGGSRADAFQEHKVEEISQLLRLVESAAEQRIVLFGTSNRFDALDGALIRSGRFENHIKVGYPTKTERESAVRSMLSGRPCEEELDIAELVAPLEGRPMSDLALLVNEAARLAVKQEKPAIDHACLEQARRQLPSSQSDKPTIGFK